MVLFGDKGDSGERKLDSSANNFERGAVRQGARHVGQLSAALWLQGGP